MPLNLSSPGVTVREVDVTVGRVDPTSNTVAAIVATFGKGPVERAVLIQNEQELLANFGQPRSVATHYETWFTASSFLAYGGNLLVLRSDGTSLYNANQSTTGIGTSIKVKSYEDYVNKGYDETAISSVVFAARTPGSWGNGLKVAIIDGRADQTLSGITTTNVVVGHGVTHSVSGTVIAGAGSTATLDGFIKGIVTGIGASTLDVKVLSYVSAAGVETQVDYEPQGVYRFKSTGTVSIHANNTGVGVSTTPFASSPDWYDAQTITLNKGTISWHTLAPNPGTTKFAALRGSKI